MLLRTILAAIVFTVSLEAQDTRVVMLGTGNPNADPNRMGPSLAVISGNHVYVVDCGPGVVRRAAQAGITMTQLTRLFVTHLHSDHTVGLADFIFTPAVTGRHEALEIFGPAGIRSMTDHIMAAYKEDMDVRLHGLEPSDAKGYAVTVHEVQAGEVYRDAAIRVRAIAVNHGTWKAAFGYRFEAPDKVIVVSGDTTYSESLVEAAKGCDILVHEVYSQKGWEGRTADWKRYHAAFHTSGPDLGRIAAKVRPKKLVLTHTLPMGEKPEELIQEIRQYFSGEIVYADDLQVIR